LSRLLLALSIAVLLLWAAPARATTVTIVWPKAASDDVRQVLTLLRGELLSVGLDVTDFDEPGAGARERGDDVAWLEGFAARGASAVVDAIGEETLQAIDVWILKAPAQRFEVTHVAVEPGAPRQPETLALRALEALRAGLLQIDWAARKRRERPVAKPALPTVPAEPVQRPEPHRDRVALEAGVVASMSLDGVGPAVSPQVRLLWAARPCLLVHASADGFGSRADASAAGGGAKVAQQSAVLGASYRLRPAHRLWPFFALAAGVLHTSVEGRPGWGTGGRSAEQWSKLIDAGVGAGLRLSGRIYLTLSLHAQLADPYVAIHIVDTVAATTGRPNLGLALTLGAWL
jgi:hypothetical protein